MLLLVFSRQHKSAVQWHFVLLGAINIPLLYILFVYIQYVWTHLERLHWVLYSGNHPLKDTNKTFCLSFCISVCVKYMYACLCDMSHVHVLHTCCINPTNSCMRKSCKKKTQWQKKMLVGLFPFAVARNHTVSHLHHSTNLYLTCEAFCSISRFRYSL